MVIRLWRRQNVPDPSSPAIQLAKRGGACEDGRVIARAGNGFSRGQCGISAPHCADVRAVLATILLGARSSRTAEPQGQSGA